MWSILYLNFASNISRDAILTGVFTVDGAKVPGKADLSVGVVREIITVRKALYHCGLLLKHA